MHLHRDLIGRVYFIDSPGGRTVLKLYRPLDTENARQSIGILQYLGKNDYPAVSIVPTNRGEMSIFIDAPEGLSVGILYDYVEGTTPDIETEIESIGLQVGRLHVLMEKCPHSLVRRTKGQYVDDYIAVMNELDYAQARIAELAEYGDELWTRLRRLPRGFCHGDMHTGNMLQAGTGTYVLFDFDEASGDYPIVDVAYLSDNTDLNRFDDRAYDSTMRMFERFYRGYSRQRSVGDAEVRAVFDIVAIRHYTILGRIILRQGSQDISREFLDEQYEWLLNWRNLCERKRP